jgi:hypothetical protein
VQTPKPIERHLSNGVLHRVGGPAYMEDYYEEWWFEGLPHRDDGPAVTGGTFDHEWSICGYWKIISLGRLVTRKPCFLN